MYFSEILRQFNPFLPYLLIFFASALAVYGLAAIFTPDKRLQRLGAGISSQRDLGMGVRRQGSALDRLVSRPFISRFVPSDERERMTLKLWLLQAGYDAPQAAQAYYGFRVFLSLILAFLAVVVTPIVLPRYSVSMYFSITLGAAILGFIVPVVWVGRRRKRRQRQVREGLPDVLDLLLICTEAGLGLDMAISRVGEEMADVQPILSQNLLLISAELLAGRPRVDAIRSFVDRTGVDEVRSLVNLLVQTDLLGGSMGATLRVFAGDMRAHQLLRAEEAAQKVTVKLSMVLVGCLMPALVTAIMAPIIFHIIATWKGMPTI